MSDISAALIWWRRFLIAITALSAAAASFAFLRDLALHVGWPVWASLLLPLSLDALAAASLTEYKLYRSRTGAVVSVFAVVASAAGNAMSHVYSTGMAEPATVPVIAVGAVPAITVWLVIHTFSPKEKTVWNRDTSGTNGTFGTSSSAPGTGTGTKTGTAPGATAPVPKSNGTKPNSKRRTDTELVSMLRSNSWQNETADFLTSRLNVSKTRALKVRELARSNGHGHD